MKTNRVGFSLIGASAALLFLASPPLFAVEQEEVPVQKVFVPSSGYDDQDNVVVRVEGTLPDPCYVLGNTVVTPSSDGKTFDVHQYAWRRDDGVCASGDDLEESPFSEDVSLGRLSPGSYQIVQHPDDQQTTLRAFSVVQATLRPTDGLDFANVTDARVPDVILSGQDVKITVTGTLSSSCNVITDVKVERQNDVFIIRPIEQEVGDCGYVLMFFTREVDLGKLPVGEYLVHVRAKNGRVVERTFQVLG